jgi:hypothetical protein
MHLEMVWIRNTGLKFTDLWGVRQKRRRYLTGGLHALVLHWRDVLKAWRRHVPVERGLLPASGLLPVTRAGPTAIAARRSLPLAISGARTLLPVFTHLK